MFNLMGEIAYQTVPWAPHVMDWNKDDLHDTPDQMAASLCEETNVTVEEFGQFTIDPNTPCGLNPNGFLLYSDGSNISIIFNGNGDASYIGLVIGTLAPDAGLFRVNEQYVFGGGSRLNLDTQICTDTDLDCACEFDSGDSDYQASALSGTMEITRCSVSERNSQGEPTYLLVDIYFECLLCGDRIIWEEPLPKVESVSSPASGWIRSATVAPFPPLSAFDEYIDEMCSGESGEEGETE